MGTWFATTIIHTGRLPLFGFLVSFLVAFLFIRLSVRMIRAQVSWWPGNITPGGMHIHHMVFGLVMMLISGFALVTLADFEIPVANVVLACVFGVGAALVLDEFALVLHLRDVYWTTEGRGSVDAVFVAFSVTALFLLGLHPLGLDGDFDGLGEETLPEILLQIGFFALQLVFAIVTLSKGKLWTGLVGLFITPLLLVGAVRLSRPGAPWARLFYRNRPGRMARALRRETRFRRPISRAKVIFQEAIAGHFDVDQVLPQPDIGDSERLR
jgi:hypothetical protein